ncbi:hypothetical protein P7C73_g2127, partial [Tremellales sp. Uapishka_1]
MMAVDLPQDLIGSSGLYNVPDPLLRRLRLEDASGSPINDLERYFKDKQVLVLYAGAEYGEASLKDFHRDLTTFANRQASTASVIYVSTDTTPAAPERVLAQKPWLRMTFHDNSDFAPMVSFSSGSQAAEVEDVSRGEDFVQAGEIEMRVEHVAFGVEEYQQDYVRPLSRAAVSALMKAFATPSIAIYHIPSHTFIAKNVKPARFSHREIDKNFHLWRDGGEPKSKLIGELSSVFSPHKVDAHAVTTEVLYAMKYPLLSLVLALLYQLLLLIGGGE